MKLSTMHNSLFLGLLLAFAVAVSLVSTQYAWAEAVSADRALSAASTELTTQATPTALFRYEIIDDVVWIRDLNTENMVVPGRRAITIPAKIEGKKVVYVYLSYRSSSIKSLNLSKAKYLEILACDYCDLTKLDVSKNKNLKSLSCEGNPLKKLNVSKNKKLEVLNCGKTQISKLSLSSNKRLTELYCEFAKLKSLDVSKNPNLERLYCECCQLRKLKLGKAANLKELSCWGNKLTKLNVSKCKKLKELDCTGNYISNLKLPTNKRTASTRIEVDCSKTKLSKKAIWALEKWGYGPYRSITIYDN